MKTRQVLFVAIVLLASWTPSPRAQSCKQVATLVSPTVTITLAQLVEAGSFTPADGTGALLHLPAFCRVALQLKPTSDSDIRVEVWLPAKAWNGNYLAVGSGGWGGSIAYNDMADALRRGYATSATDDGHSGPSAAFALGHPEKLIDFAYRAEHEMTVEAKALIQTFYGRSPHYSFWEGCSGGGREGLLQAARYPAEFDGIIAGDPANIRRNAWALWLAVQTLKDPAAYIPPAKYPMIHRAVLNACDAKDGVTDGLIEDPESCNFDPKLLQCEAGDGPECLTARQVQSAQALLSPATTPAGHVLFPGLEPGTELRWGRMAGGPQPADLFLDEFRYVVYRNPDWDWRTFDLERDAALAHAIDKDLDEFDPHLAAFANRGGKLLLYHGWADQQVAPGSSVELYQSLVGLSGVSHPPSGWVRLFMAPGMAHCAGGEGPNTFDKLGAMEQWVEHGHPPTKIIASHQTAGSTDRTRPLCPYPQVARYNGVGSIDSAFSFSCRTRR